MAWFRADGDGFRLDVKVVPGASRTQILGLHGERLRVAVGAQAEGGRANDAVRRLLADALGVRARHVEVVSGPTAPTKCLRVTAVGGDRDALGRAIERMGSSGR